ncbi:MAG: class I SAM-dependent methyltransferase [Desulfovibrio sp.]
MPELEDKDCLCLDPSRTDRDPSPGVKAACAHNPLLELDMRVLAKVAARLPVRERYMILDTGCVHGQIARTRFPSLGLPFHCLSVDSRAEAVDEARRKNSDPRFQFSRAEIEDLEPDDYGRFDIIFTTCAPHRATDPLRSMQHLWNLVAPGGALIVRAIDDAKHAIPPQADLKQLIQSTVALVRGPLRHFSHTLPPRLLRLQPPPIDLFVDFAVDEVTQPTAGERRCGNAQGNLESLVLPAYAVAVAFK